MGGDRGVGVAAPGSQAIGAREQRHLHLHRARPREVAVDRLPGERPLVHEKSERKVGAGHALEEAAQPLAGAQPPAEGGHHLLAQRVVADERDATAVEHAARGGLAHVVQERAEAQGLTAREVVRQRLGKHGLESRSKVSEELVQPALQLDLPGEHLQRVPVHVQVVVAALLHAVQVGHLGKHRAQEPEPVGELEARQHPGRHDQPAQLGEHPLRRGLGHAAAPPSRVRRSVSASGVESQLGGEAGQAQRPQRIGLVGLGRNEPQDPRVEVPAAAVRIGHLPPSSGRAMALTVKSRRERSSSIVAPWSSDTS